MFSINSGGDCHRDQKWIEGAPAGLTEAERRLYDAWEEAQAHGTSCFRFYVIGARLYLEVEFTGPSDDAKAWAEVDKFAKEHGDWTDDDMSAPEEKLTTIGVWKIVPPEAKADDVRLMVEAWRKIILANPVLSRSIMEVW